MWDKPELSFVDKPGEVSVEDMEGRDNCDNEITISGVKGMDINYNGQEPIKCDKPPTCTSNV